MADARCKGRYCYHHLSDGVDYHDGATCPDGRDGPPCPHGLRMSPEDRVQRDVQELHRALGGLIGMSPAVRRAELRMRLIEEEAGELVEAIEAGDLVGAIKEMCDVLCVTYGTAVDFGVDLAPFWDEVHRSNMAKKGGAVREDGKHLKPVGWLPPDIAGLLAQLYPEQEPA